MAEMNTRHGAAHHIDEMRAAVARVDNGESVASVARSYGVSRKCIYQWIERCRRPLAALPTECYQGSAAMPVNPDPALIAAGVPPIVAASLAVGLDADPAVWRGIGEQYPLTGVLTAVQSGVLFAAAAIGTPLGIAAARAGVGEGEPTVWDSRAAEGTEPYASYMIALHQCSASALIRLGIRQAEGMSGWQGAARQLAALRPDLYAIRDRATNVELTSLDAMDQDQLLSIVDQQLSRIRGGADAVAPVSTEVLPLSTTGMNDDVSA